MELALIVHDKIARATGHDAIINVDGEDKDMILHAGMKYTRICVTDSEAEVSKDAAQSVIPFAACLLQAVQRLVQPLD
jgi:hypothetical protein